MTLSLTRRVVAVLVPANVQHIRWPLCLPASTCSRPPCAGGKARQQGFQCRDRDDRQLPFVTSTRDDSVRVDSTRPASPCVLSASRSRSRQRRRWSRGVQRTYMIGPPGCGSGRKRRKTEKKRQEKSKTTCTVQKRTECPTRVCVSLQTALGHKGSLPHAQTWRPAPERAGTPIGSACGPVHCG